MSLEEKILQYQALNAKINALEEEKKALYKEILSSFPKNEKRIDVENFRLTQYSRLTIKTSVEDARTFDATKMEEIVDKEKIKGLIQSGIFIPNVTETNYFMVFKKKEEASTLL